MAITISLEQESWLQTQVDNGAFPSVEAAVRQLIDEKIAAADVGYDDDLAWAKPYVDEARAAVARGEFVSLEEHKAHNAALLASLRDR
jgi:antitoxin ParD1/3/4